MRLVSFLWEIVFTLCLWPEINKLDCVIVKNVHRIFLQGAFFNCSHPKISKYKKKTKYPNCSHPKISKYRKKTKYPNCSHPKISKYKKKNKVSELFPPKNVLSVEKVKVLEQTKRDTEFSAAIGMLYHFCADIVARPLVFIFHYSFILFLHMRDLSPENWTCELVDI